MPWCRHNDNWETNVSSCLVLGMWSGMYTLQKHWAVCPRPSNKLLKCKLSQWHRRARQEATEEANAPLNTDMDQKMIMKGQYVVKKQKQKTQQYVVALIHCCYGKWRVCLWGTSGEEMPVNRSHILCVSSAHKRYALLSLKYGIIGEGPAILLQAWNWKKKNQKQKTQVFRIWATKCWVSSEKAEQSQDQPDRCLPQIPTVHVLLHGAGSGEETHSDNYMPGT